MSTARNSSIDVLQWPQPRIVALPVVACRTSFQGQQDSDAKLAQADIATRSQLRYSQLYVRRLIPVPVLAVCAEVLARLETHATLDSLFKYAGAPGGPPPGTKVAKTQAWLRVVNNEHSLQPLDVLGRLLENLMESPLSPNDEWDQVELKDRERVARVLARCELEYVKGGKIIDMLGGFMSDEVYPATATAPPITVAMRHYFSRFHLQAAHLFCEKAGEIERAHVGTSTFSSDHNSYVLGSVLSSATFLESVINEFLKDASDDYLPYIGGLEQAVRTRLKDVWDLTEGAGRGIQLLDKYNLALDRCGAQLFVRGSNPYQDAALLVRLRNQLVHFKPDTVASHEASDFIRQLSRKFEPNRLMQGAGNPLFPSHIMGHGCALWALESARALADEFASRVGIRPNYQR